MWKENVQPMIEAVVEHQQRLWMLWTTTATERQTPDAGMKWYQIMMKRKELLLFDIVVDEDE